MAEKLGRFKNSMGKHFNMGWPPVMTGSGEHDVLGHGMKAGRDAEPWEFVVIFVHLPLL